MLQYRPRSARPRSSAAARQSAQIGREVHTGGIYVRDTPKVGRDDPCPCGSGRKYKHCHGR
ncbi:MAG TPA: SEC-C metal-binding domain-containing protein [Roseiflexaceae bacterium]|nr:SEC-C metal-binding domain-containing protein [Roseiflexaceae bacterium]